MAADTTKVKVGVCSVTFNAVDLGHTQGGVELKYEPTYHEVKVDQYGQTVVDKRLIGEKVTVKVPLAESSVAVLQASMPINSLVSGPPQLVKVGTDAGASLLAKAATLVLHPLDMGVATTNDVTIFKAVSSEPVLVPYKFDQERVFEVTFEALLDVSKASGSYLMQIGI